MVLDGGADPSVVNELDKQPRHVTTSELCREVLNTFIEQKMRKLKKRYSYIL